MSPGWNGDPFDLLRAVNPEPGDVTPGPDPALPDRIIAGRQPRRRYWRAWLVIPAIVGTTGAVAATVIDRAPRTTDRVGCYASAEPDADTAVAVADAADAVEVCAALWREGAVGVGPVPALEACVLPSGAVGVFPRSTPPCAGAVGPVATRPPTGGSTVPAPDVAGLTTALSDATAAAGCLTPTAARELATAELARLGLSGWRIEVGGGVNGAGFDASRPCAAFAVDDTRDTIVIVPTPAPSGPSTPGPSPP